MIYDWILKRKIKPGGIYMFPMFGFTIIDPQTLDSTWLQTHPLGKSLASQSFRVKDIKNDIAIGNFYDKPLSEDFALYVHEIERRSFIEIILLSLLVAPFVWLFKRLTPKK